VSASGVTIAGPDITGVPLFADLIVRGHSEDRSWEPYGVLGLGTVIWSIDDTTASGATAGSVQTDIDTDFAVKLGGGVDWFINNNWILNFNAAYVFSSPEATVTATAAGTSATVTDEVDLDYWAIGGGVKYLFS
jgi:outer membrane protein W